jgi:YegS/Rv2252/BmrU family lipid kinase
MTRVLLITNPAAARTQPTAVQAVVDVLGSAGWTVEVVATGGPGDARSLAAEGVVDGMDLVAVFGGDGTTMQAAGALVGTDVRLGLIPGGTGNLLAGNLRIPTSPARAAEAMVAGQARAFDLGRMERADGVHHFAVACGAGYDARVMAETPAALKHKWGMAAYVATTFRLMADLRSATHLITIDGAEYEAHAAIVLVANCSEVIPPFVKFGHGISPEDGELDVIVLRADSFRESVSAVWELLRRRGRQPPNGGQVGYARGRDIRVETTPAQPVQLDGEPGGTTPFRATVVPGAVRIMVPRTKMD